MIIDDYDQLLRLWNETEGLALSEADSRENIAAYLLRNSGLSFVWEEDGRVVGTLLAGHDGRRGYLYHLAVHPDCRKRKIGNRLVEAGLQALKEQGIVKCHLIVLEDNPAGQSFWKAVGWERRSGFLVYSAAIPG